MTPGKAVEPAAAEQCKSILYYLAGERDVWKRDLLLADFANKVDAVPPGLGDAMRELAIRSCLPQRGQRPAIGQILREDTRAPRPVDIVITTVTPLEWRAALNVFAVDEDSLQVHNGRLYYELKLPCRTANRDLDVVITSIMRPLNVRATKALSEIRRYFQGQIYFLLGIAAGRQGKVKLGDVVIPEEVLYYPPGRRRAGGTEPRNPRKEIPEEVQRIANYYEPEETSYYERFAAGIRGFAARDRPDGLDDNHRPSIYANNIVIASGEELIQDGLLSQLFEIEERIAAGDEEGFGFAEGVSDNPWAIFRGISDYGVDPKPNDWQYAAVYAAGLALRDYIETTFIFPGTESF
jgi:nucleoside phosphorylase